MRKSGKNNRRTIPRIEKEKEKDDDRYDES